MIFKYVLAHLIPKTNPTSSYVKVYSRGNKSQHSLLLFSRNHFPCRVGLLTICQAELPWGDFIRKFSLRMKNIIKLIPYISKVGWYLWVWPAFSLLAGCSLLSSPQTWLGYQKGLIMKKQNAWTLTEKNILIHCYLASQWVLLWIKGNLLNLRVHSWWLYDGSLKLKCMGRILKNRVIFVVSTFNSKLL